MDPTIVVAGIGAWGAVMAATVKGALDARAAKLQTNGMLHGPLGELRDMVADLAAEVRDVKADVRETRQQVKAVEARLSDMQPPPAAGPGRP